MKKLILLLIIFLPLTTFSQVLTEAYDTIKHSSKGNITKQYWYGDSAAWHTNKGNFSFDKPVYVKGHPIGFGNGTVNNFSFTPTFGITGSVVNASTLPNLSLSWDSTKYFQTRHQTSLDTTKMHNFNIAKFQTKLIDGIVRKDLTPFPSYQLGAFYLNRSGFPSGNTELSWDGFITATQFNAFNQILFYPGSGNFGTLGTPNNTSQIKLYDNTVNGKIILQTAGAASEIDLTATKIITSTNLIKSATDTFATLSGLRLYGSTHGGNWGTITGTLSAQTDLNTALNLKAPLISPTFTSPTLGIASATSINGVTENAASVGFTITGGTTSKTFTLNNSLVLSGTDGSTLNIGSGGTLGSNAYTSTTYAPLNSPSFTGTVSGINSTMVGLGSVLNIAQEPALGNPAANSYLLSSTTGGVRSWVNPTPTLVGLSNVENTKLSTWTGSTNITQLGTISSGLNIAAGQNYKIGNVNLSPAMIGAEPTLGNPSVSGYILSSTTGGVRSWINFPSLNWGNINGTLSNQTDLNTALNGKLSTSGTAANSALFQGRDSIYIKSHWFPKDTTTSLILTDNTTNGYVVLAVGDSVKVNIDFIIGRSGNYRMGNLKAFYYSGSLTYDLGDNTQISSLGVYFNTITRDGATKQLRLFYTTTLTGVNAILKSKNTIGIYSNTSSGGGTWGSITGTLSNQTDLQNSLDLKANAADPVFTGTVSGISPDMIGLKCRTEISGLNNTSFGNSSLPITTTGSYNVGLGAFSMHSNTSGGNNVSVGDLALTNNTTGSDNVVIGMSSLYNNTTGNSNIAIGESALGGNVTGSHNTVIGYAALSSNTTGSNNVVIGYQAGTNLSGENNKLHIANNGNNDIISGDFVGDSITVGGTVVIGKIGINVPTGAAIKLNNVDITTKFSPLNGATFNGTLLDLSNPYYTSYSNYSLTGAITFTFSSTKVNGSYAFLTIVGDGNSAHTLNLTGSGIALVNGSAFNTSSGALNYIAATWDGSRIIMSITNLIVQ